MVMIPDDNVTDLVREVGGLQANLAGTSPDLDPAAADDGRAGSLSDDDACSMSCDEAVTERDGPAIEVGGGSAP
jgi:hypothetical protein